MVSFIHVCPAALRQRLTLMLWAASIALGAAAAVPVHAQTVVEVNARLDSLFGSHQPYQAFFVALQKAVAADERQAVAALVDYPLRTRIDGKAVTINDAPHFVASYDAVVTPRLRRVVANQSYADVFANWRGVSIGDGDLWFSAVGNSDVVRIVAINN